MCLSSPPKLGKTWGLGLVTWKRGWMGIREKPWNFTKSYLSCLYCLRVEPLKDNNAESPLSHAPSSIFNYWFFDYVKIVFKSPLNHLLLSELRTPERSQESLRIPALESSCRHTRPKWRSRSPQLGSLHLASPCATVCWKCFQVGNAVWWMSYFPLELKQSLVTHLLKGAADLSVCAGMCV